MIQTLFNSLFNIWCNGVQNFKMYIDNPEFHNTCTITSLQCEFWKMQASSYRRLGSTLISR